MGAALFLFAIMACVFSPDENKGKKKKYEKKKKYRRKSTTWYDSLNEGDKAWLYSHYS